MTTGLVALHLAMEAIVATAGGLLTWGNVRLWRRGVAGRLPIVLTATQTLVALTPPALALAGVGATWVVYLAAPLVLALAVPMWWRHRHAIRTVLRPARKDTP